MSASPDRPVPWDEGPHAGPGGPGPGAEELRAMWEQLDPVPAGLADRVLFALEVEQLATGDLDLDLELMRLVQEDASAHATRGEQVRTITFGSESMTVMLALSEVDGGFRVDGWVAPGGTRHVEVRTAEGSSGLECDSTGRFTVPLVPPGHFQLVLDGATDGAGPGPRRAVVTPALTL